MNRISYGFFVQWHVTERCNLKCRHCYQSGVVPEMSYEEICRALDEVSTAIRGWAMDYGMDISPSLNVTGGEPLLRQDLFDILDHARHSSFPVSLMSNGTLVDTDMARRIEEAGVVDVQVSLEGLEPTHDLIRGKGTFDHAVMGIRNLVDAGVDTDINVTVSRVNVGEADALVGLAEELGVSSIGFSRLVPTGRGKGLGENALSCDELRSFYGHLGKYGDMSAVAVTSLDPLCNISRMGSAPPDVHFPIGGCAAGVFGVTICSDGTVMPCRRMALPIGNIKETSFRELWSESPVLSALRTREAYHGGCESCSYWAACRGCRAVALAFARANGDEDYLGPDPQCPHSPQP
jgi:radical SAM protein with 4Fe4S-binding SPASM domain